jgi:hypothetical protein
MTQITEKVSAEKLDLMYANFAKLVSWLQQGSKSPYPMPQTLTVARQMLLATDKLAKENHDEIATLKAQVQAQMAEIANLTALLQELNKTLAELAASQQEKPKRSRKAKEPEAADEQPAQPAQPEPQLEMGDLGDLSAPQPDAAGNLQPEVQGEEQINLLAADIDAGDVNPTSLAALETEISNLL